MTHGFVGGEVQDLIYYATEEAWKQNKNSEAAMTIDSPPITTAHFQTVIRSLVPALRKEGFTQIPNVTWDQVGALEQARKQLKMSIVGPIKQPKLWQEFGLRRPGGVLLWGPPGCGKTLVAQAVANDAQASFILINGPELLNKYVGESERAVRELFRRARSAAPCILFFDEIDSIVPRRESSSTEAGARVVNALLAELDGVQDRSGVYVIGTTNRKDMIDDAMLRHGRLSVHIFVDLPTADERVDILKTIYRKNRGITADVEARLEGVARDPRCENFSGADLAGLDSKAAETALARYMEAQLDQSDPSPRGLSAADWEHALSTSKPSVKNPEFFRKLARK
jgi:ribosome biogenesis ATPase